jgi:hypothetical protein
MWIVVCGFLYAIARELLDERAAVLSVVLYAFFGPSVYLETLGLHFVSSTAVFLAFFYFSLRELREGARARRSSRGWPRGLATYSICPRFSRCPSPVCSSWLAGRHRASVTSAGTSLCFCSD